VQRRDRLGAVVHERAGGVITFVNSTGRALGRMSPHCVRHDDLSPIAEPPLTFENAIRAADRR
jgi:hypothetical protein